MEAAGGDPQPPGRHGPCGRASNERGKARWLPAVDGGRLELHGPCPDAAELADRFRRDIVPVGLVGEQPMVIAVASSLGVKTLPDLLALAAQRPGQLAYGMTRGGIPHMTMEMVRLQAGIDLSFVPYTATQQVVAELMGGRIALAVDAMSAFTGVLERGGLRALAISSPARLPDYPDLPTVSETLPGFQARGWFALMAPAGTPGDIIKKLNQDLSAVLEDQEVQRRFRTLGTYVRPMSPAQLGEFIRQEQELWLPIVKKISAASP